MSYREACQEMANGPPKHGRLEFNIMVQNMKPDGLRARGQEQGAEVKQAE